MDSSVLASKVLRREVLVSLLVVGVASTSLGMVTWSYFADSNASQQNALQGGTLDLTLDGSDSLSTSFSITNGGPGTAATHNYTIRNNGSLSADHLEIALAFTENDSRTEPSDPDLDIELNATETASLIRVTQFEYKNSSGATIHDALSTIDDQNGNGVVDLSDVENQLGQLDDLTPPQKNSGNRTFLVITVELANDDSNTFVKGGNTAGNLTGYDEDVMADGVDVTITVTLNQAASQ